VLWYREALVTDADDPSAHYRLRGEVGGTPRSYALRPGENSVGSRTGNAIVLPVRGVSRRHALMTMGADGLILEDLGSRNGTSVNGVRVQRSQIRPGDEIRFGPVTLRLEEVEGEDAVLAILLDDRERPDPGLPGTDTTGAPVDDQGRISVVVLEALLARIGGPEVPDLPDVVGLLGRALEARSACVFETVGGEPVALATYGPLPDPAHQQGIVESIRHAPAAGGAITVFTLEGETPLSCAVIRGRGPERIGVVVTGTLRSSRAEAEALLRIVLGALQRPREQAREAAPRATVPELAFPKGYVAGDSPAMRALYAQLRPLVRGDLPVLLLGETGVGKELLARILHDSSPRRRGPFVAINCAAIPADLLEAEMFGIAKGVATGVTERRGRFQSAEGGTLLLDEIGDMPVELQAKLLRALQEKEVQPVGGAPAAVDIRVIAATNSDLHRRMEEGRFRRDLYFRVAGFALRVPPLRERREDIPALLEAFTRAAARAHAKTVRGFTVKALRRLIAYAWPGNVRELEHEAGRLVALCPQGEAIDSTMISPHILGGEPAQGTAPLADTLDLEKNVDALERRLISQALAQARGNRTRAAKLLGVSRNGLAIKMERLGLTE
jgi:DNA-binding NtrC family response regulator